MEHSEIILQMLQERGITPYKIAKETDISMSLFSKWKKHPTSEISSKNLCKIADYLNCSLDELTGRKPRAMKTECEEDKRKQA